MQRRLFALDHNFPEPVLLGLAKAIPRAVAQLANEPDGNATGAHRLESPGRCCSQARPAALRRYRCRLLLGLSGMVGSTNPSSNAGWW